jgi:hypothetical protein
MNTTLSFIAAALASASIQLLSPARAQAQASPPAGEILPPDAGDPPKPAVPQEAGAPTVTPPPATTTTTPDPRANKDEVQPGGQPQPGAAPAAPDEAEAKGNAKKAEATATPLSAVRGGTLGFPALGAAGIVAALKLQGGSGQTTKFDVLAQIGQLELSPNFLLDVVAERVTTDVPGATFAAGNGRPLPKLRETTLTSAGFRLTIAPSRSRDKRQLLSSCLSKVKLGRLAQAKVTTEKDAPARASLQAQRAECTDLGVDVEHPWSDAIAVAAYTELEEREAPPVSFTIGGRFLYRSEDITGNAPGAAGETTLQFKLGKASMFLSESVLWLRGSENDVDDLHTTITKVVEARSTIGAYYKFNAPVGKVQTAPRVGGYAAYARNFWKNPYAEDGTDARIRGYQLEGGLFVSGHFSGGFNGLIQLGMRRGYGVDSEPQFIFTVVPSLGSDIGGGTK